ncbi:MAG: 4'-phosphopantetheinyl transferase superfamily protein, partial [Lachnospiraceae bacterium]|nr:4'-phosphopantetheinyl transferase superfamily protein [Lachnospiraceae bacterium]
PDAFLRRCAFHYIDFPDEKLMREIVLAHYPDIEEELMTQAMDAFFYVREYFELKKKPSTSELLDWINALQLAGIPIDNLRRDLPLMSFLLKKDEDRDRMFFSIWSAKESFVKYTGRGIGAGIDQCVTDVELSKIVSDDRILNIRLYEDIPGYSLCVCSERQEFPDKICMFLIDETGNIVASDID